MTTPSEQLSGLIDAATKAAGGQNKAAKMAGISAQHLSKYRNGEREAPPEAVAALAHVAGLDAIEWLARATLWRSAGKPYEGTLKAALGKCARATAGGLGSFLLALVLAPTWVRGDFAQCIKR